MLFIIITRVHINRFPLNRVNYKSSLRHTAVSIHLKLNYIIFGYIYVDDEINNSLFYCSVPKVSNVAVCLSQGLAPILNRNSFIYEVSNEMKSKQNTFIVENGYNMYYCVYV